MSLLSLLGFWFCDTRMTCLASHSLHNWAVVRHTVDDQPYSFAADVIGAAHLYMSGFARKAAVPRLLVWLARLDFFHCGVVTAPACQFCDDLVTAGNGYELEQTSVVEEGAGAGASHASSPILHSWALNRAISILQTFTLTRDLQSNHACYPCVTCVRRIFFRTITASG